MTRNMHRVRTVAGALVFLCVAALSLSAATSFAGVPVLLGDYDVNGIVAPPDAQIWENEVGTFGPNADGNFDGVVDATDLQIVIANLGSGAEGIPPDATPAALIYNSASGNVSLDQSEAEGGRITAFYLNSAVPFAAPGVATFPFPTPVHFVSTEVDTVNQIGQIDVSGVGLPTTVHELGPILPSGMSLGDLESALADSFYMGPVGAAASFRLVVVPEPSALAMFCLAVAVSNFSFNRRFMK